MTRTLHCEDALFVVSESGPELRDVTSSVTVNFRPIAAQLPQNFHTSSKVPLLPSK